MKNLIYKMNMISILTVNCQGLSLGDYKKRKNVFDYLKKMNHNIYCLQETHFKINQDSEIRASVNSEYNFNLNHLFMKVKVR